MRTALEALGAFVCAAVIVTIVFYSLGALL
jgi:hypothetical protein